MKKHVAFLRAINVGGNTIIKMADLKRMCESVGLQNVQTYIQSGNVIFESDDDNVDWLEKRLEERLEQTLGKSVQVFIRTIRQVQSIAEKSPFTPENQETLHVVFLKQKPDKAQQQAVLALKSEADDFAIRGQEVYNLRRDREKSVFSNNFLEKLIKLSCTTRNMTVIKKIAEKYT